MPHSVSFRRFLPFALMIFLAACAGDGDIQTPPNAPDGQETASESLSPLAAEAMQDLSAPLGTAGNYLASRAALQEGDFTDAAQFLRATLAKDPNNLALNERAAVLSLLAGDIDAAIPLCAAWAERKPDSLLPNLVLILKAAKNNDTAQARELLAKIEARKNNPLTGPLLRAWLSVDADGLDAAIAIIQPQIDHPTAGGIVLLHAALLAEYARDFEKSRLFYETANSRFTVLPLRLAMNTGQLYERLNEEEAAKKIYVDFNTRSPNNYIFTNALRRLSMQGQIAPANIRSIRDGLAQVMFDIATSFEGQQSNELALIYARLAEYLQPDFPFNQLLLAELAEQYEQFELAAQYHRLLMANADFSWAASLRLARNYDKLHQPQTAIKILEDLRRDYPNRTEPLTMLGDLYRNAKDYPAAIEAYSEAIAQAEPIQPMHWPLFYARGVAFERSKLWKSAEADLERAIALSPDQPYVLNYLAYSWVERGENLGRALEMLQRATALAPDDAFIIDSLGWAYYRLGRYAEAVVHLARAVELRPFDPQLVDHYGDGLWRTGQREQARQQWQRALGFKPDADLQKQLDHKIDAGLPEAAPGI
jgi:tetratricopeptide (TPR) repeat protein